MLVKEWKSRNKPQKHARKCGSKSITELNPRYSKLPQNIAIFIYHRQRPHLSYSMITLLSGTLVYSFFQVGWISNDPVAQASGERGWLGTLRNFNISRFWSVVRSIIHYGALSPKSASLGSRHQKCQSFFLLLHPTDILKFCLYSLMYI